MGNGVWFVNLSVQEFSEQNAIEMCQWRYEPPYEVYNCPDWGTVKAECWGMADDKKRKREFYSVCSGELLIGFFRLVKKNDCVMVGQGLHPDAC